MKQHAEYVRVVKTHRQLVFNQVFNQAAGLKHILLSDLRSTRTQNESLSPAFNAAKILHFLHTSIDRQCFFIVNIPSTNLNMKYGSSSSAWHVQPANVMFMHGLGQMWEASSLIEQLQRRNYSIALISES